MENGHRHIDSIFSTKLLVLGDGVEYKATFKFFEVSAIKGSPFCDIKLEKISVDYLIFYTAPFRSASVRGLV